MPDGGLFGMYTDWWNDGVRATRLGHLPPPGPAARDRASLPDPSRSPLARDRRDLDGRPGDAALRGHAARLLRSVVGFSAAFPDMQAPVVVGVITGLTGNSVYEVDLRLRGRRLRRGQQSAGAGAQLRAHPALPDLGQRAQLPAGPGHRQQPRTRRRDRGRAQPQQEPFAAAARAAGADDHGDDLRRPHLRRLGPRVRRRPGVGVLQAGARAAARLGLPDDREERRDVGPSASASPSRRGPSPSSSARVAR